MPLLLCRNKSPQNREKIMTSFNGLPSDPGNLPLRKRPKKRPGFHRMLTGAGVLLGIGAAFGIGSNYQAIQTWFGQALIAKPVQAQDTSATIDADGAGPNKSVFARHVREADVEQCADLHATLGDILTVGSTFAAQSIWDKQDPTASPIQTLVGLDYSLDEYRGAGAGYVFSTPKGKGCAGAMIRVVPFAKTCAEVLPLFPAGSESSGKLGDVEVYALAEGGSALLIPTPSACTMVTLAVGTFNPDPNAQIK
jgi:hypothetical protein